MLSDVEICHLQRSIAFHRRKQADEIKSRDYTISSLQSEIRSLGSITSKHQDQFMAIKEKLVVALTEVETQRILLDGERKRSAAADASLEQAENAFQLARQEKDFVRKQLAEAEGLIALSSQHRSRAQEQETALLHSREQLRILTDVKNSLDSQLAAAVRDLEVNKFKSASLELKTEAVSHEKVSLTEVVTELKQQLSKMQIKNAEEVSEIRRELLRAKDLVESERLMRMKSHSDSEMQRIKELEDRSKEAEEKYRLSQIPSVNEKETKLSLELEAMSQELVGKERERVLEAEKVSTLGLQLSTMQIQLDANLKRALEMDERYDAIRAEGRYARQQVLDMVGFVTDIITATCLNGNLQDEVLQQGQKSLRVSADSMRAPGHILLLSPRAKAAIKDGGLVHLKDCRSPAKRLFPDESNKCIVEHDPFDLAILHGLNDALCLPDLRSVLQTLRDRFEKVFTTAQQPEVKILNVDTSDKNAIRNLQLTLEASETTIKILENNVRVLQTKEAELIKTINQLDSEIKNHQVLTKKKDRTNAVLESELKIKAQLDAERALLHSQVASLQEQVATLTIDAHGTVRSSIESTEYSAREQETQIAIDQSAAPAFADKQSPPVNLSEVDNEENGTITGPFVTDADQSVGLESMPQRTEVSASIHSVLSVGSQLDDPFGTMNPLASQLHVVDDMQCEFTAAQDQLRDNEVNISASLLAAVREKDFDELNDMRMKLKWAKNHHRVMQRVILQLERELKTLCKENVVGNLLHQSTTKKLPSGSPVGSHHPSMRDSKDTSDLFPPHSQDSPHSKQSLLPSNIGNGVEGSSAAYQALKKLEIRTALQDRILSIYRESLFALKYEIALKLPYPTSSGNSITRDEVSRVGNSVEGEAHQALNSSADYDHDRDYSIRSLYLDEDFNRRHLGSLLPTDETCGIDLAATRRDVAEEEERIQGPVLWRWLDSEIAAIKENYEEEINTLEEIITTLRTLTTTTKSKKKRKPKSVDQINPLRWSQSDDFVVRHVDKT